VEAIEPVCAAEVTVVFTGNVLPLLLGLNRSEGVAMIVVTHSAALAQRMESVMKLDNGQLKGRGA